MKYAGQTGIVDRRTFMAGTSAFALTAGSTTASAFFPAVVASIEALVTIWSGYKMLEEVYSRTFGTDTKKRAQDEARIVQSNYVSAGIIQNNNFQTLNRP